MPDPTRGAIDRASEGHVASHDMLTAYNGLVGAASLVSVGLIRSVSEFHAERFQNPDGLQLIVPPPEYRSAFDAQARILQCGARLRAMLSAQPDADAATAIALIEAEYVLDYRVAPGPEIPPDAMQVFAYRNGVFNAWPFFRELAFSLTSRMNIPPLIIPLFKLPLIPQM